ncbi:YdiU family protein [Pseudenhygromyxa sp. WMMC2535]|uniref:protein adenylyltransferase SelO n=1 Tax=Pseudenhygromyxa sp. WMMC2535 TaxID=2712867 RepID=UPI00155778AB|nr:YdiU family protein [Pseudenhygromyxa sp. WMMC2535]NVB37344.1 YdiU family protein [Pseudenhygromyxa sp. WMMC2535]
MQAPAAELALRFDNSFVRALPADPEPKNYRRQVLGACYSRVDPTPVSNPALLAWSGELAQRLGLPADPQTDPDLAARLAQVFAGVEQLPGMAPFAACYGGHQFGNWADQLGDGRAISLGEVLGEGGQRWELQLKGAGPTPYSRMGDGRAVLRSSVREFLCSEAMHHLGVPTTRALSLVTTGDAVVRDMFYDGHPRPEPGAIVCRVAPSFLRFGNFELFAARDDRATLARLADYAIETHFPALASAHAAGDPQRYARWFVEIAERTAEMIAHWMRVGFVHGVMNTDNMSILGLTIDYGPYGWIDDYDPDWTPNTTDASTRRYRFGNQPRIAAWNLLRMAAALRPLIGDEAPLQAGMDAYAAALDRHTLTSFAAKLGLAELRTDEDAEDPRSGLWLVDELLTQLATTSTDMTLFYRALADLPLAEDCDDESLLAPLLPAYYEDLRPRARAETLAWLRALTAKVRGEGHDPAQRRARMNAANPKYVLRNYLAQQAIERAEAGDQDMLHELQAVLRAPYDEQPGREHLAAKRPDWAKHRPGCSMLSCSS